MERTGWFDAPTRCVNRLHENVVWGMRGNFLYLPTDCPQRDERLGWTGDIQVFAPTASYLYDCDGFLASWLRDLALEQQARAASCRSSCPIVLPTRRQAGRRLGRRRDRRARRCSTSASATRRARARSTRA